MVYCNFWFSSHLKRNSCQQSHFGCQAVKIPAHLGCFPIGLEYFSSSAVGSIAQTASWTPKMPQADNDTAKSQDSSTTRSLPPPSLPRQWFRTPAPIKRLFDTFPLQTLAPNPLPVRSPLNRSRPTLYIFTTPEDAVNGEPSFNPSCLKWQTYLLMSGLEFSTKSSNNHASPSGALPFLLPASIPNNENPLPIPTAKLHKWLADQKLARSEPDSMRYEAYMALLDHRIRRAWVSLAWCLYRSYSS